MTIIKTHLRTYITDHQGNIQINKPSQQAAFSGVYMLGLIMGSQDDETRRLPIPDSQLPIVKQQLDYVIGESLNGISAIGALLAITNARDVIESELSGIGSVIQNLALLALESQDHLESVEMDIAHRNQAKETARD